MIHSNPLIKLIDSKDLTTIKKDKEYRFIMHLYKHTVTHDFIYMSKSAYVDKLNITDWKTTKWSMKNQEKFNELYKQKLRFGYIEDK